MRIVQILIADRFAKAQHLRHNQSCKPSINQTNFWGVWPRWVGVKWVHTLQFCLKSWRSVFFQICKLSGHGWVAAREFFEGHVLRLVVGQPQVSISALQRLLGFLQVINRLVDFINGRLKPLGRQFIIFAKGGLECVELVFEMGNVNVLAFDQGQFRLVLQSVHGRVAQQ